MAPKSRRSIANAKTICGQCKLEIIENKEDNIECDKCSKKFHSLCTRLDKRQYQYFLDNESEEYVCHLCAGESDVSITAELREIKTNLKKLDQLSSITQAIEFMSSQYDELLKCVAENNKKLEITQKENRILKNEVNTLKESVKFLNGERVKNDCIVRGVVANNNETAVETIIELSKKAGVELKQENINEAYFFKNRGEKPNEKKTMVVKFSNKNSKDKLMMCKAKLKDAEDTKKVYISDYLSKETLNLFHYAKSLKTIGYNYVYTSGSRVFARKTEISRPKLIRSEDDVDKIMSEAATLRQMYKPTYQTATADDDENQDGSEFLSPA